MPAWRGRSRPPLRIESCSRSTRARKAALSAVPEPAEPDAVALVGKCVVAEFDRLAGANQRHPSLRHLHLGLEVLADAGDLPNDLAFPHQRARSADVNSEHRAPTGRDHREPRVGQIGKVPSQGLDPDPGGLHRLLKGPFDLAVLERPGLTVPPQAIEI